jgi:4-amino-4-deoxy-L-arabinose transferase-like glycosyltransferase
VTTELTERVAPADADRTEPRLLDRARMWVRRNPALVVIAAAAFAVRLGWVLYVDVSPPIAWQLSGDQYSYYHYGREIAAGRGYVSYITGEPTAYYPIGYPAILAILFWLVARLPLPDDYVLAANLMQVVAGTASVVLVYLIGRKLFGRLAGLVGAGILAIFPNVAYQVATFQLETMFIFLCLAALAIVVLHDWETGPPSTRRLVAFGAVLGVSVIVRPFSIWFVVALLVAALVAHLGWRRSLAITAIPLAVVVLMSLPWTIRNAIRMDAFVVSSTNTGDGLCLDRSMDATGGFRWADHEGCADPNLPEVERNVANTKMAIKFVLQHPGREAVQIGRRARLMFANDHDGIEAVNGLGDGQIMSDATIRTLNRLGDVSFHLIGVLAGVGLVLLLGRRNRGRPEVVLVLLSMASLVAVPLLLWGNPRFHLPVSPFLAILAGGALAAGLGVVRARLVPRAWEWRRSIS